MTHRSSNPSGSLPLEIDQLCPGQHCLAEIAGRRLSARILRQEILDTKALPPSSDLLFVHHVGGAAAVERWYEGSISASGSAPGTVTVLPSGRSSGWRIPNPVEVFHLYIPGDLVAAVAERDFDIDTARIEIIDTFGAEDQQGLALAKAGVASLRDGERGALFLDSLAQALAVYLLSRHAVLPRPLLDGRTSGPGALSRERLARVRDFVEARLGGEILLDDLAATACLSTFHFCRSFRAATGTPPRSYVMRRRAERGRDMLSESALPIAQIAYLCGFASQSHFNTVFRKQFGTTPGSYRRQMAT